MALLIVIHHHLKLFNIVHYFQVALLSNVTNNRFPFYEANLGSKKLKKLNQKRGSCAQHVEKFVNKIAKIINGTYTGLTGMFQGFQIYFA